MDGEVSGVNMGILEDQVMRLRVDLTITTQPLDTSRSESSPPLGIYHPSGGQQGATSKQVSTEEVAKFGVQHGVNGKVGGVRVVASDVQCGLVSEGGGVKVGAADVQHGVDCEGGGVNVDVLLDLVIKKVGDEVPGVRQKSVKLSTIASSLPFGRTLGGGRKKKKLIVENFKS